MKTDQEPTAETLRECFAICGELAAIDATGKPTIEMTTRLAAVLLRASRLPVRMDPRRGAACLDACAGISTEFLESVSLRGVINVLANAIPQETLSTVTRETLAKLRGEG